MKTIFNSFKRITNAIKLGWWGLKNPEIIGNESILKMLGKIFELILKVSIENKNYMTHLAFINPDNGEKHEIVSIWAGAGIGAEPTKRIQELIAENQKLKLEINTLIEKRELKNV